MSHADARPTRQGEVPDRFLVAVALGGLSSVLAGVGVLIGAPLRCSTDETQWLCSDNGLGYVFLALLAWACVASATAFAGISFLCWTHFSSALNMRLAFLGTIVSLPATSAVASIAAFSFGQDSDLPALSVAALVVSVAAIVASVALLLSRNDVLFLICTTMLALSLMSLAWYLFLPAVLLAPLALITGTTGVAALAATRGRRAAR